MLPCGRNGNLRVTLSLTSIKISINFLIYSSLMLSRLSCVMNVCLSQGVGKSLPIRISKREYPRVAFGVILISARTAGRYLFQFPNVPPVAFLSLSLIWEVNAEPWPEFICSGIPHLGMISPVKIPTTVSASSLLVGKFQTSGRTCLQSYRLVVVLLFAVKCG